MSKNDNLLTCRASKRYPDLNVMKYTRRVFYDNLWNDELIECRGRVVDSEGNTVINPFTKIFNYMENGTTLGEDETCLVVEKINGFLACATYVPMYDEVIVSTTGSLDSEYADIAKRSIPEAFLDDLRKSRSPMTYMFEIVSPDDRLEHPVKEDIGCYLIGVRGVTDKSHYFSDTNKEKTLDMIAGNFGLLRPKHFMMKFSEVLKKVKESHAEGFVVYSQDTGRVLKIKTPYYLTKKAFMRSDKILSGDKSRVDEEFYPLVDYITEHKDVFQRMDEKERKNFFDSWFKKS